MKLRILALHSLFLPFVAFGGESFRILGPSLGCVMGYAESKRFEFPLRLEDFRRAPKWSEDNERPPLSPRRAGRIAKKRLSKLLDEPKVWSRAEIILRESPDMDRWYYVVEFERDAGSGTQPPRMRVVVLMDGAVPKPIEIKYP